VSEHYILDGHTAVPVDLMTWARWFDSHAKRHVADETVGDARVSTVFLGIDHSFGDGPPMIFETMIFGGEHDEYMARCSTWEEAEAMHDRAVAMVKS
jgi:hypothetical protein